MTHEPLYSDCMTREKVFTMYEPVLVIMEFDLKLKLMQKWQKSKTAKVQWRQKRNRDIDILVFAVFQS